jgi:hypothetical protein
MNIRNIIAGLCIAGIVFLAAVGAIALDSLSKPQCQAGTCNVCTAPKSE